MLAALLAAAALVACGTADTTGPTEIAQQDTGTVTGQGGDTAANPADSGASGAQDTGNTGSADTGAAVDAGSGGKADVPVAGEVAAIAAKLKGWCSKQDSKFSFFVTSMNALWTIAGDPVSKLDGGLGGDLGGVQGADNICQAIATAAGHGDKTWRAALCATKGGPGGGAIHAGDRIGKGPWYDANGRLVAKDPSGLVGVDRPAGDAKSTDDLPDECGVPLSVLGDAHDVATGCNKDMKLASTNMADTCNDWTTSDGKVGSTGGPKGHGNVQCGHSFPRKAGGGGGGGGKKPPKGGPGGGMGGANWISDHPLRGCGKGANLLQNGSGSGTCIGCTGGYGAIYCFAQ